LTTLILVLIREVSLGSTDQSRELLLVLAFDVLEGEDSGGLFVDYCPESGLALDDDIWDTHLAAQGGEENNELDGVDVVGDDDERGFLGFNEGDGVVKTVLCEEGLLGVLGLLLLLLSSGLSGSL